MSDSEPTAGALRDESADYVVCFDRDFTIDVNPPVSDDREAVPLWWVKQLAHAPEFDHVDVWATGNQRLCGEADIPGFADARALYEDYWTDPVHRRYPSRSGELDVWEPSRQLGLQLIYELYQVYDGTLPLFIVVDDFDLRTLEGFDHYFPWDFVDAVENGQAPLEVGERAFCNTPADSLVCSCTTERSVSITSSE